MSAREVRLVFEQIVNVAAYAQTGKANWETVATETVVAAQSLVARVHGLVHQHGLTWMAPHVSSDGQGAISFEWWRGPRSLTLYAYADGVTESLLAWGADMVSQMESQDNPSDEQICALWNRIMESD